MNENVRKKEKVGISGSKAGKITEPNFNTELARFIRTMHPEWRTEECVIAEKIGIIEDRPTARPDIVVCHPGGIPVVVETEFNPARTVEIDAKERLGQKLVNFSNSIEQSIAVRIPNELASAGQVGLYEKIGESEFEFCVFSQRKDALGYWYRWPENGWITGKVQDLADFIELASMSENILNQGLDILETKISDAAAILRRKYQGFPNILNKISDALNQKDGEQTSRMAMAIVLNAITFHKSIAGVNGIRTFEEIWNPLSLYNYDKNRLIEHWTYIVEEVNYLPIFKIAIEILLPIESSVCKEILRELFSAANNLEELGATSRHDFSGRMFQRLITDRKFLATFYTLPSSAALLAEMSIERLEVDWEEASEINSLRIADFACGTGALLNASLHSILTRHNRTGGNGREIHKFLVEEVITGVDIMPAATHLTASVLAGVYSKNKFEHTSIITLPYGKNPESNKFRDVSLGALDLLDGNPVLPIFDTGDRKVTAIKGKDSKIDVSLEIPDHSFDLVIMNPPFTRPTNHESNKFDIPVPSFAGLEKSSDEQRLMSERLKKLKNQETVGSGHAGLASNFFDIAHVKVKSPNGVIALVLPSTFLKGSSWESVRQCLELNYSDIVIFSIASSGSSDRAFSADTNIAEILVIATRKKNIEKEPIKFINLIHRPKSIVEAVMIARKIIRNPKSTSIYLGDEKIANISIGSFASSGLAGVLHESPALAGDSLSGSKLVLPRLSKPLSIPMIELRKLGSVGLLDREVSSQIKRRDGVLPGPFDLISPQTSKNPTYPILWWHNAQAENRFIVKPDAEGSVRENRENEAIEVWNATKSRLHLNRDFRLNSQPLTACITEQESIGGRAWPNYILNEVAWEIPMVLWLNTTIGLITFWWQGGRQQIGRVILTNSQLPNLLVLDMSKLTQNQLKQAGEIFDSFKDKEFLPANEAWNDNSRHMLDQAVLGDLLGISKSVVDENLSLLRQQWCEEPSVHGGKSTAP